MANINLKNALTQLLQSLHRFGVGELTAAQDKLNFDFSDAQPVSTDEPKPAQNHTPAAAKVVEEPKKPAETSVPSKPPATPAVVAQPRVDAPANYQGESLPQQERERQLSVIQAEVESCEACYELCRTRTKTVFGVGDPEAKIVFLGEGPGANEDRQGEPFVGEAGKLLDKILNASTLKRDQVYILNTVKCRPPNNRNPLPAELENCRGFLDRQLDVIRPEFIVCLGSVAAKSLLGTKLSLGKLRKQFHQYRESKVLVTYHPAYLLRTPSAKTHVWEDMKMLMKALGVEL